MISACTNGTRGTQAHIGQLELLAAIGCELDERGDLLPAPPYNDVCMEGDVRLSFQIRVF